LKKTKVSLAAVLAAFLGYKWASNQEFWKDFLEPGDAQVTAEELERREKLGTLNEERTRVITYFRDKF